MFKADFHIHTTFSDGTFSPEEVLELAKEKKISAISFTDHENIQAFGNGRAKAKELGIFLIPGVEVSTKVEDSTVHILGYSFGPEKMQTFLDQYLAIKKKRNEEMLKKLNEYGMQITMEDLSQFSHTSGTIGRVHIAQALLQKGFVRSLEAAFQHWIGDHQPCFVKMDRFSVEQTITHIHQAGGLAVLAHPHFIQSRKILDILYNMPFDGIEANYALFSDAKNIEWMQWASDKGWFCTGGSDFHGAIKPQITLGCNYCGRRVFDILYQHFQNHGI